MADKQRNFKEIAFFEENSFQHNKINNEFKRARLHARTLSISIALSQ